MCRISGLGPVGPRGLVFGIELGLGELPKARRTP